MNIDEKITTLKYTIDRYDHYYDSINNKGNAFLVLNTLFFTAISAFYSIFSTQIDKLKYGEYVIWIPLLCIAGSIYLTLTALKPSLKSNKKSMLFFNDVAQFSIDDFRQQYANLSEQKLFDDLIKQTSFLAKGLKRKFEFMCYATNLMKVSFIIAIAILILLSIKINN